MKFDLLLKNISIIFTFLILFTVTAGAVSAAGISTESNVVDAKALSTKSPTSIGADCLHIRDWGNDKDKRSCTDFLYIGDRGDNTVKRFNGNSGKFIDNFVSSSSGGLYGPGGILFDKEGNLLVSNQNVNQPISGDILQYNGKTGVFEKALVDYTDTNAPFAPRGIILKNFKLYVASYQDESGGSGGVLSYNIKNGKFLGDFDPTVFTDPYSHPRGIVVGPDGKFYVSIFGFVGNPPFFQGGQVLRFKSNGEFDKVFISDEGGVGHLNRPEGLVFGPDGNLYITSFMVDPSNPDPKNIDSIRIYDGKTGVFLREIPLDTAGQPRSYAQALLFGPNGRLFVPITGSDTNTQGEVRRYNVADITNPTYDILIKSHVNGGELIAPWYLTFGKTDPTTLGYSDHKEEDHKENHN